MSSTGGYMNIKGVLVVFLFLFLIGCGSSSSSSGGSSSNSPVTGTWKMMSTQDAGSALINTSSWNLILTVAANGTWTFNQPANVGGGTSPACSSTGTSSATSTTLIITTATDSCHTPPQLTTETNNFSISGTTLTITTTTGTIITSIWAKQ